jgi:hypothetical protein
METSVQATGKKVRLPLDEPPKLSESMSLDIYLLDAPVSLRSLQKNGLRVEIEFRNETDERVEALEMKVIDKQKFFEPYTIWEISRIEARGTESRGYKLRLGSSVVPRITKIPSALQFEYCHESWTAHLEVGLFRGQLCEDYRPPLQQEQYNIAIVGPPGSGKSMLINMIHTMLTAPCSRISMIAPVGPFTTDTSAGEVQYEPYPLYKKFKVKATLWEATPFTETTIQKPAFSTYLTRSEMPSSISNERVRQFDSITVLLPENYLTDGSPPDSIVQYLRDLFDDDGCQPLLCISQTTEESTNFFEVKRQMQKKLKLKANAFANCRKLPYFGSKEKERRLDVETYDILDSILKRASTRSFKQ